MMAPFIISTQDSGERGCLGVSKNASFLGRGIVRSIRTSKSIARDAIHETKNRYDKAAAGRGPVEIMKEAM